VKSLLQIALLIVVSTTASAQEFSYLGVTVTAHITEGKGVSRWIAVEVVKPDGPAAKAGLRKGDLITAIDGRSLVFANEAEALRLLTRRPAGKKIMLSVLRDRNAKKVPLIPATMTAEQQATWQMTMKWLERTAREREMKRAN
jgi:S1-C subfamily serine protease